MSGETRDAKLLGFSYGVIVAGIVDDLWAWRPWGLVAWLVLLVWCIRADRPAALAGDHPGDGQ